MALTENFYYRFLSEANNNYALKACGTYSTSGTNVCLGPSNPVDNRQKWKYQYDTNVGYRLHFADHTSYVLDRSDGSLSKSYNNNAHLCITGQTSATDSALTFEQVSGMVYRIRLTNRITGVYRYLTAANVSSDAAVETVPNLSTLTNGKKNVYWAEEIPSSSSNYSKQCWRAVISSITDESFVDHVSKQYLVPPYPVSGVTADYDEDCDMIKRAKEEGRKVCSQYPFRVHWGIDFAGRNSSTNTAVLRNIKSSGYGRVMKIGYGYNLGNTVMIKYPNAAYGTGSSKRNIYFLYCHLESISVTEGQDVFPDTLIGVAGQTGEGADSNHLHLEAFTQQVNDSPSDEGNTTYCVDPTTYFFNSSDNDDVGLRTIVPDSAEPFGRLEYCPGGQTLKGFTCIHDDNLYFYNTTKIYGRGNYQETTFA